MINDNFKWIDCDKLAIVNEENNPRYWSLDDFAKQNINWLINHKLENINKDELCEHILYNYQRNFEKNIEYHLEKLYSYIFRFIYIPEAQNYFLKVDISEEISCIEDYLKCEGSKDFIKEESKWWIDHFKNYYRHGFNIKEFDNIDTADILIETYRDDVIKKYATDPNIIY